MSASVSYLQLEPTTRCNYTCGFCAGRYLPQVDMDFDNFTQIIDALPALKHVELQGEGEPLMHPQFFAMVNYIREKCPDTKISIITNGSQFTPNNIENILTAGIDSIMVSLESADENQFRHIRGGKLSRVKRGITQLVALKQAAGYRLPRLGFAVTLLRESFEQLSDIAVLYQDLGLDGGMIVQGLQTMPAYRQFYDEAMLQNILQTQDFTAINQIIATDTSVKQLLLQHRASSNFYAELYASTQGVGCPWLGNGLSVTAQSIATSCCFIKNAERDGLGIWQNNLNTILEKRELMAKRLYGGDIPQGCLGCSLIKIGKKS